MSDLVGNPRRQVFSCEAQVDGSSLVMLSNHLLYKLSCFFCVCFLNNLVLSNLTEELK